MSTDPRLAIIAAHRRARAAVELLLGGQGDRPASDADRVAEVENYARSCRRVSRMCDPNRVLALLGLEDAPAREQLQRSAVEVVAELVARQLEQKGRVLAADPVAAMLRVSLGLSPDPMAATPQEDK